MVDMCVLQWTAPISSTPGDPAADKTRSHPRTKYPRHVSLARDAARWLGILGVCLDQGTMAHSRGSRLRLCCRPMGIMSTLLRLRLEASPFSACFFFLALHG